jgi:hypothetical protein
MPPVRSVPTTVDLGVVVGTNAERSPRKGNHNSKIDV